MNKKKENEHKANKINKRSYLINKKSFAFTLSELLMSVLVVSIILVAMAPVITKRTSDNISVSAVKYEGRLFEFTDNNSECTIVEAEDGSRYKECPLELPNDVNNINVIAVSAGGGGAGSMLPGYYLEESYEVDSSSSPYYDYFIRIYPFVKGLNITLKSAGGTGGGARLREFKDVVPTSQLVCDAFNAIYVATGSGTGICVTKKNLGDLEGYSITKKATVARADNICTGTNCCWMDTTSDGANCTLDGTYPTCTRIVCTKSAAKDICADYKYEDENEEWALPTNAEISKIYQSFANGSTNGKKLELCNNTSTDSNYCAPRLNGCLLNGGSEYSTCMPGAMWAHSDTPYVGTYGTGFTAASRKVAAASVRCVLRKLPDKTVVATGGGGASGISATLSVPQEVLEENMGGFVMIGASKALPGTNDINSLSSNGRDKAGDGFGGLLYPILNADGELEDVGSYVMEDFREDAAYDSSWKTYIGDWAPDVKMFDIGDGAITFDDAAAKLKTFTYATFANIYSKDSTGITYGIFLQNGRWGEPGVVSDDQKPTGGYGGKGDECGVEVYLPAVQYYDKTYGDYYYIPDAGANYNVTQGNTHTVGGRNGKESTNYKNTKILGGSGGNSYGVGGQGAQGNGFELVKDEAAGTTELKEVSYPSGKGAKSYSYLNYAVYGLDASDVSTYTAGAGGGGGQLMELKNLQIENGSNIKIYIGEGGKGGYGGLSNIGGYWGFNSYNSSNQAFHRSGIYCRAIGSDGTNGGKSGIKVGETEYSIEGGKAATAATLKGDIKERKDCDAMPNYLKKQSGIGKKGEATVGVFDGIDKKVTQGENGGLPSVLKAKMKSRLSGDICVSFSNEVWTHYMFGGIGGKSPISKSAAACGGFLSEQIINSIPVISSAGVGQLARHSIVGGNWATTPPECSNTEKNGQTIEYRSPSELFLNKNYGSAGAGGGGGGWYLGKEKEAGAGGDGQNGYVYVYWVKVE